jgi:hypothetical protein
MTELEGLAGAPAVTTLALLKVTPGYWVVRLVLSENVSKSRVMVPAVSGFWMNSTNTEPSSKGAAVDIRMSESESFAKP